MEAAHDHAPWAATAAARQPGFITASLLLALAINLLPLGPMVWMPDALILALAFWGVHQPWRVGMGIGLCWACAWMCTSLPCWVSTLWPTPC
jgi:hypothetical protein